MSEGFFSGLFRFIAAILPNFKITKLNTILIVMCDSLTFSNLHLDPPPPPPSHTVIYTHKMLHNSSLVC